MPLVILAEIEGVEDVEEIGDAVKRM